MAYKSNKQKRAIWIITAFSLIILIFFFSYHKSFRDWAELKVLDIMFNWRGNRKTSEQVVIACIDEKSLSVLGRWPWPRIHLAKLVDKLSLAGARVIGFDIIFPEYQDDNIKLIKEIKDHYQKIGAGDNAISFLDGLGKRVDHDYLLADSIKRADNVVLGYYFYLTDDEIRYLVANDKTSIAKRGANQPTTENRQQTEDMEVLKRTKEPFEREQFEGTIKDYTYKGILKGKGINLSIKELSEAARGIGYINCMPDDDGVVRRSPLLGVYNGWKCTSLAIELLKRYYSKEKGVVSIKGDGTIERIIFADGQISGSDRSIFVDKGCNYFINFLGRGNNFKHYSISDILQDKIDPLAFKDKVVLVGATAIGIYDLRVTPLSGNTPGVEIHANIIDNIINNDALRLPDYLLFADFMFFYNCILIIAFGILLAYTLPRLPSIQGLLFSSGLAVSYTAFVFLMFKYKNIWLHLTAPLLTIGSVHLIITTYRFFTEERQKWEINKRFKDFVAPTVVKQLLENPQSLKLEGQEKDITVTFSDIRDFTSISEVLNPKDVSEILHYYLEEMSKIIFYYEGCLDKYIGDAIMAFYNAPLDQADHPHKACYTSLKMLEELKRINKYFLKKGLKSLTIGIGINSGNMRVGNMGSFSRFNYSVIGDNVNLASRLEGLNKRYGTNIILSEFTYNRIREHFICRELDMVKVKGKEKAVTIYELIGEKLTTRFPVEVLEMFAEGLNRYRKKDWCEAIKRFDDVLRISPEDRPSKIYIDRCQALSKECLPDDWDGVIKMMDK
ncbi:MAG: adenylate/guanylate cyclase domain-containing protein [bacterium]